MNTLSFLTSNYATRPLDYRAIQGERWLQGIRLNNAYFQPLETFEERFGSMLADIQALGFESLDIWTAHLNWEWAKSDHLAIARDLLARYSLQVKSLVGNFGRTPEHIKAACRVAQALDASLLSGMTYLLATKRELLSDLLREHGIRFGFENHPEKTPTELLRRIGGGSDVLGVTLDTGWFTLQGYDVQQAIQELHPQIFHVHLKDLKRSDQEETCLYGNGCIPVAECLSRLRVVGYAGSIGIEHEQFSGDPGPVCQTCLTLVRGWLNAPVGIVQERA